MVNREWSLPDTDTLLDAILRAATEAQYNGIADHMAVLLGRVGQHSDKRPGDPVTRHLWGLATGLALYPGPGPTRTVPGLGPISWAEHHIISMAWLTDSKEVKEMRERTGWQPTASYFAALFDCSMQRAGAAWMQYGPAQGRGEGFGLDKQRKTE